MIVWTLLFREENFEIKELSTCCKSNKNILLEIQSSQ